MKRLLRLIATIIVLILFSVSPAQALFGSDCKKPKAQYVKYLSSSKALKIRETIAKNRAIAQADSLYKVCLKNPKLFLDERGLGVLWYPRNREGCATWKRVDSVNVPFVEGKITSYEEYKNAMLIVTNYKKCFDPSVYIQSVKWLKANPR